MEVPDDFMKLLVSHKITTTEDFALMAASESEVKSDIFAFSRAGGVELKEIKAQVSIKKLWLAARKQMPGAQTGTSTPSSMPQAEDGISKEPAKDLTDTWKSVHGFILPDNWLVTASNQKQIWKSALQVPPQVEVMLMEQLRMHSQRTRISGTMMSSVPGQAVYTSAVDIDTIHAPLEVAMRAKAWFMTTALVCIHHPVWFDFQTAVFRAEVAAHLRVRVAQVQVTPLPDPLPHTLTVVVSSKWR